MSQQLREEIRREMRTEHDLFPVQQLHQEINRDTSYDRNSKIKQLDLVYREQERIASQVKIWNSNTNSS